MTKRTKVLLAISLTGFSVGFTGILWGFGMPLGAVFFGLFLISKVLEKETALFDEEQRLRVALAENCASTPGRVQRVRQVAGEEAPLIVGAHSH